MKPHRKHEFDPDSPLDPTAARPIFHREDMLECQYRVLTHVVMRMYEVAEREALFMRTLGDVTNSTAKPVAISGYRQHQEARRPNQLFFIDGARGAGKTSLLITLKAVLGRLGRDIETDETGKLVGKLLQSIEYHIIKNAERAGATSPDSSDGVPNLRLQRLIADSKFSLSAGHDRGNSQTWPTATCLSVIHPADLEEKQPVLESIFAQMAKEIQSRVDEATRASADRNRIERLIQLRQDLSQKVARGWHLSRQSGIDAILRDSVDYEDYLEKISAAGQASHDRVSSWREYVNAYLDTLNIQLLVILLDDADNRPEITLDLMHTIRIFLDHPRVVTILAGNLRSIRQSLMLQEFTHLSSAMSALRRSSPQTERELRQMARRHSEEFLEKVLPRPTRFLLDLDVVGPLYAKLSSRDTNHSEVKLEHRPDGYQKILGCTFDEYCAAMLDKHRTSFIEARRIAHLSFVADQNEISSYRNRSQLENYMSWWLLRFWYAEWLMPRSVRHLIALRAYTWTNPGSPAISDRLPSFHEKRLAVILFESPDNSALLQRFGDHDTNVVRWMHRQTISSHWRGDRYFEINGVKHYSDTYSYRYILYRIDLGIGLPVRFSAEESIPDGLLPNPAGPNLMAHTPFFPLIQPPGLSGVASQIGHSLLPANCYFFYGLQSLVDLHWDDEHTKGKVPRSPFWGHTLIFEWSRLFHFEDADKHSRATSGLSQDEKKAATIEWCVRRYLKDVVIPLGALHIGSFVSAPDRKLETLDTVDACAEELLLTAELRPKDKSQKYFQQFAQMILQAARRIEYYDTLGDSTAAHESREAARTYFEEWMKIVDVTLPSPFPDNAQKQSAAFPHTDLMRQHLISYRWLINDIRRAHAAARIFLTEIDWTLAKLSEARRQAASGSILSIEGEAHGDARRNYSNRSMHTRYTVISRRTLDRWLGKGRYGKALGELLSHWQGEEKSSKSRNWVEAYIKKYIDAKGGSHLNSATRFHENVEGVELRNALEAFLRDTGWKQNVFQGGHLTKGAVEHLLFEARKPMGDGNDDWHLLFDPRIRKVDEGLGDKKSGADDEKDRSYLLATGEGLKNRIARSYFSFVGAIAVCLPSAIHLEISSLVYDSLHSSTNGVSSHSDQMVVKKLLNEALDQWEIKITEFLRFMLRYRVLLEIDRLVQDILARVDEANQARSENVGIRANTASTWIASVHSRLQLDRLSRHHLALAPDFSYATLGVRGRAAFSSDQSGILDATLLPPTRLEQPSINRPDAETRQIGEWQTTVHNLVQGLNFIRATRLGVSRWSAATGAPPQTARQRRSGRRKFVRD